MSGYWDSTLNKSRENNLRVGLVKLVWCYRITIHAEKMTPIELGNRIISAIFIEEQNEMIEFV